MLLAIRSDVIDAKPVTTTSIMEEGQTKMIVRAVILPMYLRHQMGGVGGSDNCYGCQTPHIFGARGADPSEVNYREVIHNLTGYRFGHKNWGQITVFANISNNFVLTPILFIQLPKIS